jgi:ferritin-like metal-binding protein YciE
MMFAPSSVSVREAPGRQRCAGAGVPAAAGIGPEGCRPGEHSTPEDAYSFETQLVDALPKLAEAASSEDLKAALEQHLTQTNNQVQRLEQVAKLLDCELTGNTCEAMEGLIEEGEEIIDMDIDGQVKDAGLIAAAQKVEHYEIASYGCLCTWARDLGLKDAELLLHQTLQEEKQTDEKLTEIAESHVNLTARR